MLSQSSSFEKQDDKNIYNPQNYKFANTTISKEEHKLYELIMAERAELGLPSIPLSKSLTYVAQVHTWDQNMNYKYKYYNLCNLHSWSSKSEFWKGGCYSGDHKNAQMMWIKPKELTKYRTNGYECSHMNSMKSNAESAFNGWKSSAGHYEVIVNKGIWASSTWNAIGIGISGKYANIWFGKLKDNTGDIPIRKK